MKNPILAFLLAFFPGGGLLYIGKQIRGMLYAFIVIGLAFLSIIVATQNYFYMGEELAGIIIVGFMIYCISIIDTWITASRYFKNGNNDGTPKETINGQLVYRSNNESERFFTIILSFIPGLGQIQLGLMYRGITLLTAFFGLGIMIIFVSMLTSSEAFLIFLLTLPIIWIYSFFDAMQQVTKKQRGEELLDVSVFQDFEKGREEGKKSKTIATFLSVFPGAGHLYLGLQRRGIQLMAAFLFSIFILNELQLGLFLFLIPIIWFYSFFDGLQKASKASENEKIEDTPVISYLINHQKWLGIGLVLLGCYYLFLNILLPIFSPKLHDLIDIDLRFLFNQYFQTGIVCLLFIAGGIRLLMGNKRKK